MNRLVSLPAIHADDIILACALVVKGVAVVMKIVVILVGAEGIISRLFG